MREANGDIMDSNKSSKSSDNLFGTDRSMFTLLI